MTNVIKFENKRIPADTPPEELKFGLEVYVRHDGSHTYDLSVVEGVTDFEVITALIALVVQLEPEFEFLPEEGPAND